MSADAPAGPRDAGPRDEGGLPSNVCESCQIGGPRAACTGVATPEFGFKYFASHEGGRPGPPRFPPPENN